MTKPISLFVVLLLALTSGCGTTNANDMTFPSKDTKDSVESKVDEKAGKLFGGKCAKNQKWMADLEFAISAPADWQEVYDLTDVDTLSDTWGLIFGDGNIFTDEQNVKWEVYRSRIAFSLPQGNYGDAIYYYEQLYPLMEMMDLACGVAVTGRAALSTTILP